jgi:exodeoxyribonuclease-3
MEPLLISWNVNSLKSLLTKEYITDILNINPNIIGLCEVKSLKSVDLSIFDEYPYKYWNLTDTGYSGTGIMSKKEPLKVTYGFEKLKENAEGRIINVYFKDYILIQVYSPNAGVGLKRLNYKLQWNEKFKQHVLHLQKKLPVIISGDLNVAHKSIDLKNPNTNKYTAGYSIEERKSFQDFLNTTELIDGFRKDHPTDILYSFWSYRNKSRSKNIGWRLDYILVDNRFNFEYKVNILTNILGSDHAPVILYLKL